jgi:uncharacterized oxidoreductase
MKLNGVKVMITGGTSGIGRKTVEALLEENAKIIVVGRDQKKLDLLRESCSLVGVYCCDLADPNAVLQLAEKLAVEHPDLQVLINNAAVQYNIRFDDDGSDPQAIIDELHTNFSAPLLLIRMLLPTLTKQTQSAIINVTTGLALVPKTNSAVYCGSKGGLRIFTQALRNQLHDTSVRVIEILPPIVDTPMTAGRGSKKLSPEKIADEIIGALRGKKNEVYVGKTKLLYWISRISPSMARYIINRVG